MTRDRDGALKAPIWNPTDYPPPPDYGGPDPMKGKPGGAWILDRPQTIPALWGHGDEVVWPQGEPLMVVGADGSGKSILAQNLIIRMLGLTTAPLLGLPVLPRKRVLYLAQDRPNQAARAMRRLVGTVDRDTLDAGLKVIDWPIDPVEKDPEILVALAQNNDCDVVIVDSVKDVVMSPKEEDSGQALRRAYALCIAQEIDVLLSHHDRKPTDSGRQGRLLRLADVYGSRFMVAGCGSVIALNGGSGDPVIELRQLKQPASEFGPLQVLLDFETGEVNLYEGGSLLDLLRDARDGLTASEAGKLLYGSTLPTNAATERARRKLKALVDKGAAIEEPGSSREAARFMPSSLTTSLTQGSRPAHGLLTPQQDLLVNG